MTGRDWEKFGEDIRKTVQDAIDSQDFNKLNQTITNTINHAVNSFTENYNQKPHSPNQNQGMKYHDCQNRGSSSGQAAGENMRYSRPQQAQPQPVKAKELPELYRSTAAAKVGGTVLAAVGFSFGGIFTVLSVIYFFGTILLGNFGIYDIIATSFFITFMVITYGSGGWGLRICGRVKRFRSYLQVLGRREYCNTLELADKTHTDVKRVVKDLEKMISSGWFVQGHLDRQKTCLITSHRMYDQYLRLETGRKQCETADSNKKVQEKPKQDIRLSPEVQKIVDAGDDYIRQIHAWNDAIPGEEISAKISRIELVVDRIFDEVEQNPETVDDIHKLMDYYLPTTVKLLKAYHKLDSQPVDGENIRSSKAEIEATLDTLNIAFEKLLDNLFQDTAWDVSSDISVLHTMLAQEGLTEDGLKK